MEPNPRRRRPSLLQTSITSLGDDLLGDILLRLPSLVSVARAALACERWRRLATSRDFLRRFLTLHPSPPLLGCFMSFVRNNNTFISFNRAQIYSHLDLDVAAAIRGGDFLLTGLEDERQWSISDCHQGFLLLASQDKFALFNPVSRRQINISRPTGSIYSQLHCCILPARGLQSFRLVSLHQEYGSRDEFGYRLRAHVYSSDTGEWLAQRPAPPSIRPPAMKNRMGDHSPYPSMHAAGRIYWKYEKRKVLLSLDTMSMEFSNVTLPPVPGLYKSEALYAVGDTEEGACCLVCVAKAPPPNGSDSSLQVWLRDEEAGSWKLEKEVFSLSVHACKGFDISDVRQICTVTTGVVLVRTEGYCFGRCLYVTFCLKTLIGGPGAVGASNVPPEAEFLACRGLTAYPYLFVWPSSLLQHQQHSIMNSENATNANHRPYLTWTEQMDTALLEVLVEHHNNGDHVQNEWKAHVYTAAIRNVREKCAVEITKDNISSRCKIFYQDYDNVSKMLSQSGFGWDWENNRLSIDSEDVWQKYVENNKAAGSYRTKVIKNWEAISHIYSKDLATGEHARTGANNVQEIASGIAAENVAEVSPNLRTTHGGQESNRATKRPWSNNELVGMLGDIDSSSFQPSLKSNVSQLATPEEILLLLKGIPDLSRADFLRAYSMLTRDDRQFKSLLALDLEMRKDWLLMELGIKYP